MDKELLSKLIDSCLFELSEYVTKFEGGSFSESSRGVLSVLEKLKESVEENKNFEPYLLQGLKSISAAVVKDFEGTGLEKAILMLNRFMRDNIPSFASMEPLRADFNKYFR
jgi:hypothetical protein